MALIVTLKSAHGKYIGVQADGRVTCNATVVGEWEQFRAEQITDDKWALKSWRGTYLTAELDGSIRADHAETVYAWEEWRVQDGETNATVALINSHGNAITVTLDGLVVCRTPDVHAWECFESEPENWWKPDVQPPAPVGGPLKPLQGYVRAHGSVWHDDSGPRAIRLCSYFQAIRHYRDYRDLFTYNLDSMVGYWHGARVFWCLMGDPWDGKNYPEKNPVDLSVDVHWPDYDELFIAVLREFEKRGLRMAITSGTLHPSQIPDPAEATYARIGRLAASFNQHTVIMQSVINEPGMTSPYGDGYTGGEVDPGPWQHYHKLLNAFRAEYPWNAHGTGCQGGDPEAIENGGYPSGVIIGSKAPSTFAAVQGTRYPWQNALERAFDMGYNVRRAVRVPVLEEEPAGNNGNVPAVFQPMDDPDYLFAYYTIKLVTGQALIQLNSCGLWEQAPLDSIWGFKEIPLLWDAMGLPDSVGQWIPANLHKLPVTGTGMYRCDGSFVAATGETIAIAHGDGPWTVTSKATGQAQVFRSKGLIHDVHVNAGGTIFSEGGKPKPVVIHLKP